MIDIFLSMLWARDIRASRKRMWRLRLNSARTSRSSAIHAQEIVRIRKTPGNPPAPSEIAARRPGMAPAIKT
jgi:hypothetical protein